MQEANAKIRQRLKEANLPYWRLAKEMGVCENTIMRKLRVELGDGERIAFEKAIDSAKKNSSR